MKIALLSLFWLLYSTTVGQVNNPYLKLRFDRVVMYAFSGGIGSDQSIVDNQGNLAKSITKQVILDKETALSLSTKLGEKGSYNDEEGACFEPGLGFVYYLKGKIVAHVTVCLKCNLLVSSIPLEAKSHRGFWTGDDVYLAGGLTKSLLTFFERLLEKYNFYPQ